MAGEGQPCLVKNVKKISILLVIPGDALVKYLASGGAFFLPYFFDFHPCFGWHRNAILMISWTGDVPARLRHRFLAVQS